MAEWPANLCTCPTCGLVQTLPVIPPRMRACYHRCHTTLAGRSRSMRTNHAAAALALAALVFYPLAMTLPMVRVERMGYTQTSGVLTGIGTLFGHGQWFIA